MAETNFDIIIVGGGPGGYVAAIRAAQLGMKTAVVEREHMGGICLNWGCIPTKALLRTSEVYGLIKHADSFGLSVKDVSYDPKKIVERSRKVANQLSNGVKGLMKKNKITVFDGTAKLAGVDGGQRKLAVAMNDKSNLALTAKNVILATGARARQLPGLESDGKLVWTYKEAMVPPEFPKSLLVIGSGAIGIEFASFYRTMGAEVTVAEVVDRILPIEDEEVSAFAKRAFEKQGMKILTGATVGGLKKAKDNVTATITAGGKSQEITVDRVISAVGI
ncbi:MAG TPA: FAD-dependent oxidoreductase, partial [Reyranella sp.]|nr:FAD-dependent oxidoreductase [Reyranella sp.]